MTTATPPTPAPAATTPKELAVRWLDLISAGDVEELCRTASPTWSMAGGPPGLPPGPDGIRALVASFGRIRQHWTVEDVIAEGGKVVVRATNHCEQDEFLGVPATGIEQVFAATFVFRIVDGHVEEIWRTAQDLQRLLQLGATVLPPSQRASMP
ncbi:ester cyclase [Pseudonocardia kujensis]|uniref:nuclear transport factor 2 family protein n=1 Tax=Pseudonocardia kujensis TaxID=1128675 RepID=UPI001E6004A3|nr:nuclear transport factor 2 family protein [Pseudonocardia kujensis]MCE0767351.1 ester cyclase [Pseudonocardia kujensis]